MSRHSSKHHHSSTTDSNSTKLLRNVLAFFLFMLISVLTVSVCVKTVVLNPNEMAKRFTSQEYVNSMYLDAKQFAYDLCDECSIPRESVDEDLTFSAIYSINEAYAVGSLSVSDQFTQTTYKNLLDDFNKSLSSSVSESLKKDGIEINSYQQSNGVAELSQRITDYVTSVVEFEYMEKLQTLTNMGKAVLLTVIIASTILSVLLALVVFSIGKKRYRGLRAVAYSFIASAIFDFVLVLGVEIVKMTKTLVIYPTYLRDMAMQYVADSTLAFVGAGVTALFTSLIIMTVVWRLKRNEK